MDAHFINLQYGDVNYKIDEINKHSKNKLINIDGLDLNNDIDGLATAIQGCDLIISIDNTTAHLAGSIGTPTWVLLPYSADWRWFENIDKSLWYKNITLFRQGTNRMWPDVIKTISEKFVNYNCKKDNV